MSATRRARVLVSVAALALAAVVLAVVHVPTGLGAFVPKITSGGNTVNTRPYFTCASATQDVNYKSYLTWPLGDSSGSAAADASGNGRTGTYSTSDVSYNQTSGKCARDTTNSVFLDGSGGMLASGKLMTAPPSALTLEGWFRTGTAYGFLVGFGNNGATTNGTNSTDGDRRLYVNSSGQLVFGTYNPSSSSHFQTLTTGVINDNKLHYFAATYSTSAGMALYLDGKPVSSNSGYTTALTTYSGSSVYLRVGYDNLDGWPGGSTSQSYFQGYVSFISYYNAVLPASIIGEHYSAGLS